MSAVGTIQQPMERGGFTQAEAEALEVVVRCCDRAVEQAKAIGDDELVQRVDRARSGDDRFHCRAGVYRSHPLVALEATDRLSA
ncbi:MAG TPA: hypothetical protein VGF65_11785 [Mycobacterium sp.]